MTNKARNRPRKFPTKKHLADIEAANAAVLPNSTDATPPITVKTNRYSRLQRRKLARLSYGVKKPLGGII